MTKKYLEGKPYKEKVMLIVPMLHQGGFERVCVATAKLLEPFFETYVVIFDSSDIAYDIKGINVIDLHLGAKKSIFGKAGQVVRRMTKLISLKKKLKIDVSYSFGSTANLANVLSPTGDRIWTGIRSYMDMGNSKRIRQFCNKSDLIISCAKVIEEEIQEKYRFFETTTLYNPIDIDEIRLLSAAEQPKWPWIDTHNLFISMGREDDIKGFWHLIKAFAHMKEKCANAKLAIIGDGDFDEYRRLAATLDVADSVYFTGLKRNPFPYLKDAAAYVLTSYHEGFPNALAEAMALGVPVIATDCLTGPREILTKDYQKEDFTWDNPDIQIEKEYGILVPNMDPVKNMDPGVFTEEERHLADTMLGLVDSSEKRAYYRKKGYERVKEFSKYAYVDKLKKMIHEENA